MWVLDGEKIGATQAHKSGTSRDISTCSEPPRRVTKVGIDFCREKHPNCVQFGTHMMVSMWGTALGLAPC